MRVEYVISPYSKETLRSGCCGVLAAKSQWFNNVVFTEENHIIILLSTLSFFFLSHP